MSMISSQPTNIFTHTSLASSADCNPPSKSSPTRSSKPQTLPLTHHYPHLEPLPPPRPIHRSMSCLPNKATKSLSHDPDRSSQGHACIHHRWSMSSTSDLRLRSLRDELMMRFLVENTSHQDLKLDHRQHRPVPESLAFRSIWSLCLEGMLMS